MRKVWTLLIGAAALAFAAPASAEAELKYAAPPTWVQPLPLPAAGSNEERPASILLQDQQILVEKGRTTSFTRLVLQIHNSAGLAAGNISLPWNPATQSLTVNRLLIRRGAEVIDVLAGGQRFTTLRRETNLDAATLDGILTANIQPEGLQEGDAIELATTLLEQDPVMQGHVQGAFAAWNGTHIRSARARVTWPSDLDLKFRYSELTAGPVRTEGGVKTVEIRAENLEPLVTPKGAPARFALARLVETSDFDGWAEVGGLLAPLFQKAAVIAPAGPLRTEVEKIRASTSDPAARVEQALALVQSRVRYVALLMGEGGYVPATAEETWARRYGDCKAKTALLLALLNEFGVEAEPVAVHSSLGDAIPGRLPMLALFDHVIVRATVGGRNVWLDGTRTGDTSLKRLRVPAFGWGLPLVPDAKLVRILPSPLDRPDNDTLIEIDATAGVFAQATVRIEEVFRGDSAILLDTIYSQLTAGQREEALRKNALGYTDTFQVKSSSAKFDKATGELRMVTTGEAKLKWDDDWFYVPTSTIAFNPDFHRQDGPNREAPFVTAYPGFTKKRTTIKLPPAFMTSQVMPQPVSETLAGVEYRQSLTRNGNSITVDTSERVLLPEVPYKEAIAAAPRLKALHDAEVNIRVPESYRRTPADLSALTTATPASAHAFIDRGIALLDVKHFAKAEEDFTKAAAMEPGNVWAFANRAMARVWRKDYANAEKDLAAADAIDPDNYVAARARGLMAANKGDFGTAVEAFSKILKQRPTDGFALYNRARAYAELQEDAKALSDLDKIVAANPADAEALIMRALVHSGKGNHGAVDRDVAAALAAGPDHPFVHHARARIAFDKGDLQLALTAYSKQIEIEGATSTGFIERARVHSRLRHDELALADSERALKTGFGLTEVRLLRANIFKARGERDQVVREAELLVRETPGEVYPHVAAGRIYAALGLTEKAMGAFAAALAIRPEPYIYVNRAQSRPRLDRAGRRADFDAALKLDPSDVSALAELAPELVSQGELQPALELYERVAKLAPDDLDIKLGRAIVLEKMGRATEARALFSEARANAVTSTDLNNICWTKALRNVLAESAVEDCREALRLEPQNYAAVDSLGLALLRAGQLQDALVAYDKAVEKRMGATSLMGRAIVHARLGDKARAEADRAAAIESEADVEARFAEYGLRL
ncbi:MAG: DUF3857 domain-containing protein [Pseudomonadota bacterium]|nr:DUF3857 domain-containing protein [Pseudomonadota bacterium]